MSHEMKVVWHCSRVKWITAQARTVKVGNMLGYEVQSDAKKSEVCAHANTR